MYTRHGDSSCMLTVKSVLATDHLTVVGTASQGCIDPGFSIPPKLDAVPEVGSPWKPVEINLERRFTSMSRSS